jgi:hypothetical protein
MPTFGAAPNEGAPVSAHCGEAAPRSEMPVLEEEQGPPPAGATERTLLDHACTGQLHPWPLRTKGSS